MESTSHKVIQNNNDAIVLEDKMDVIYWCLEITLKLNIIICIIFHSFYSLGILEQFGQVVLAWSFSWGCSQMSAEAL